MWDTREDDVTKELRKKEFRMSVETFHYLLDLIGVNLQRIYTRFRKAIKVEKRLAIVIWRLSAGNSTGLSVKFLCRKIYRYQNIPGWNKSHFSTSPYVY